jgi:penicillin-binding protein 1A
MARKSLKVGKLLSSRKGLWRKIGWTALGLVSAGLIGLIIMWSVYSRDADKFLTYFTIRSIKTISKVMDRNGDTIGIFAEENREVIPFGDIPKAFMNALVATEDADFMTHSGVSGRGLVRAGWNFLTSFGRRREGASTLTMQLIRTVTDKRQKRLDRKLQEIILARKLEKAYTKKQILEQYANEVYFGGGRHGIEAAAKYYFGKSAPQLNVEECALLAGLVQSPNWYNPYNPDPKARAAALARRNHVLDRMVAENYLKPAEAEILKEKPIRLARGNPQEEEIAPYPVEEVRKYLYDKYGKDAVLTGGLEVYTTIDSVWQEAANKAVRAGVKAADRRRGFRREAVQVVSDPETVELPGWKRFLETGDSVQGVILGWVGDQARVRIARTVLEVSGSAFSWAGKDVKKLLPKGTAPLFLVKEASEDGQARKVELDQEPTVEGALLAVDPPTGEIRAMVGGYDFKKSKFNRTFQAERQVGSTMKAFIYGTAFTQGRTPATIVNDVATRFTYYRDTYEPKNYEHDFWGPIPIWEALRESRNIAAVRTLEAVGIENAVDFAHKVGITSPIPGVPSMALGSADLTLKDLVRGYATFANGGLQSPPPFLIRKVVDRNGRVLESYEGHPGEAVVDSMSNYQLIQCLEGVAQRGTGARTNDLKWTVAGKTGTTDDHTDAWFLGFSTRICTGVWVGLDEKKTIFKGADGAKVAVPIWVDFMRVALSTTPREDFPVPEGMEWADIDRYTGLIATSATQPEDLLHLAFKPGTQPKAPSTGDVIQKIREAREKAHYQAAETREWGTSSLIDAPASPPTVDWKQVPDPNK